MINHKYSRVHTRAELEAMHTMQLLARLRHTFKLWMYENSHDGRKPKWRPITCYRHEDIVMYQGSEEEAKQERKNLYEILATREHIPNKQESRVIRQAKQTRKSKARERFTHAKKN